jgi:hypothetical protein
LLCSGGLWLIFTLQSTVIFWSFLYSHSISHCPSYINVACIGRNEGSLFECGGWGGTGSEYTPLHVFLVSSILVGSDLFFPAFWMESVSCSQTWLCLSMNKHFLSCRLHRKPKQPRSRVCVWYDICTISAPPPTPPTPCPFTMSHWKCLLDYQFQAVLCHPVKKTWLFERFLYFTLKWHSM